MVDADPVRQAAVVESSGPKAVAGAEDERRGRRAPGRPARHARRSRRAATSPPGAPWCPPATRSTTSAACSTSTPRRARTAWPSSPGAAFSPGYSCVLARHAARRLRSRDRGARGPQRHRRTRRAPASTTPPSPARPSTGATATGSGARPGRAASCAGSPIRSAPRTATAPSCPDALLLVPAFPGVERVTARLAATRRDRFSAHLPMLRKPHPEGLVGAVRVEVRGTRAGVSDVLVLGALDRPAVAAGATAALALRWAAAGRLAAGRGRPRRSPPTRCRSCRSWSGSGSRRPRSTAAPDRSELDRAV